MVQKPLHALIVEDSEDDALLIVREFERGGSEVVSERVDTAPAMQAALGRQRWDVVISDYSMPQFSGLGALQVLKESGLDLPFIIVSGAIGEDLAVEAMRLGAHDYVMKDRLIRLVPAVERELREAEVRRERRQAEQNLRHAEKLASLGTFAAGIAHEINNPLAAIQMTARYGLKAPELLPELKTLLTEIVEDAERCTRIVASVLQFARKGPSPKELVALANVLRVASDQANRYSCEHGVRVNLQVPEGLPMLLANATELEQVFINLITNAAQASQARQVVTVHAELQGKRVRVCVEDHGRGMSEELRVHAFDPFFTTRASEGGTGLGLSMAHGIVLEHRGSIHIDSEPGRGTTVMVELPCAPSDSRKGQP
jgi:signal transduction histidine kinase